MNLDEWEIDPREIIINFNRLLGKGTFCDIYAATWRGLTIAVKYFNPACLASQRIHLKKELDILVRIHHPHIIQILGVCYEPFMILLEYMPYGSLDTVIMEMAHIPNFWVFRKKKAWTRDLCMALCYLHERKPHCVIHRDLKPSNILIGRDFILKLSDFGISKVVAITHESQNDLTTCEYTFNIGTYNYMAPEVMKSSDRIYDVKIDIWALGLILYELWEARRWNTREFNDIHEFKQYVNDGIVLKFSRTPRGLQSIIKDCIAIDPKNRPTAADILHRLQRVHRFF